MPLSTTISPSETMLDGDPARYMAVGADALRAISAALGPAIPRSILDLPCGHGRVARHLRAAYPEADLFVADLDEAGAAFCAAEFAATKLDSAPDFAGLDFGRTFDLIWVGSLITHLDAQATRDFFVFLARHLSPAGHAVVTSHGAFVAGRLFLAQRSLYGMDPPVESAILQDYFRDGYGYRDYPGQPGYGISVASRDWIAGAAAGAGLRIDGHRDHAWDNHQDVVVMSHA